MSPASDGYGFDGLVRNTGAQVDPSGNMWLTNNWEFVPLQTNPGDRQPVVAVGLAAPVRTPLIGLPRPAVDRLRPPAPGIAAGAGRRAAARLVAVTC